MQNMGHSSFVETFSLLTKKVMDSKYQFKRKKHLNRNKISFNIASVETISRLFVQQTIALQSIVGSSVVQQHAGV